MNKPELPEPDGCADLVVGSQRVGGMIGDVIESRPAWGEEKMLSFYAKGVREGMEKAAGIAETRPLMSGMDEWDSTAAAIRAAIAQESPAQAEAQTGQGR